MDMPEINKQVEVLNDLIQINNDRIEGYKKALSELGKEDEDLLPLFKRMINNSLDYNEELERQVELLDCEPATGTSGAGKLYRAWMEAKSFFTGGERKTILESCETGEKAALRFYDEAIAEANVTDVVLNLIAAQREEIRQALIQIQALIHSADA